MSAFPIQRQIHPWACIAASACSLAAWHGVAPPEQAALDDRLRAGMQSGSGFAALEVAWGHAAAGVYRRFAPPASDLARWVALNLPGGFLIAHGNQAGAHITVIFQDDGAVWQADPGPQTVRQIDPATLIRGYAGDVAVFTPPSIPSGTST